MSIFASQVTATHAFECDPSQSFTVRKMDAAELGETQKLQRVSILQWAARVVCISLVGWTVDAPLPSKRLEGVDLTDKTPDEIATLVLADLVDEAVDQITMAALKVTKPSAFETKETAEVEQKND